MNIEFNQTLYLPVYLEYLTQYCQTLKIPLPLMLPLLYCWHNPVNNGQTHRIFWLAGTIYKYENKMHVYKILENLNFF